jgi:tetratricopeptide (TPR) repeat protein
MIRGEFRDAETELLAALALAEQIGDREHLVTILAWLTVTYRRSGDSEKVRSYLQRSTEVALMSQIPVYTGIARANKAWLAWLAGNFDEAQAEAQTALELFDQYKSAKFFAKWLMTSPLMDIALRQGCDADAIQYARKILDPSQMRVDNALETMLIQAIEAWDAREAGRARRLLEQANALAIRNGWM